MALMTYSCCHFISEIVVSTLVSFRDYIGIVSLKAHSIIPNRTAIWRPNSRHLPQNFGIVGNDVIRTNSYERAWPRNQPLHLCTHHAIPYHIFRMLQPYLNGTDRPKVFAGAIALKTRPSVVLECVGVEATSESSQRLRYR